MTKQKKNKNYFLKEKHFFVLVEGRIKNSEMKFFLSYLLASIGLLLPSISGQSTTPAPGTNQTDLFYNGTTSLLTLTRKLPMTISVSEVKTKTEDSSLYLGDAVARVNFPEASKVITNKGRYSCHGLSCHFWGTFRPHPKNGY